MKILATGLLALCATLALVLAGEARAEDEILTITGQVVVEETTADGGAIVRIVTETDTYRVHHLSKAENLHRHKGRQIAATGTLYVSEVGKSIAVAEYAVLTDEGPPVGAK